ncbi:MAG: Threonine dehydrogenase and related Zn-dependent dehydrogenases, partial [uncultured Thermomicrobiales bacterium]
DGDDGARQAGLPGRAGADRVPRVRFADHRAGGNPGGGHPRQRLRLGAAHLAGAAPDGEAVRPRPRDGRARPSPRRGGHDRLRRAAAGRGGPDRRLLFPDLPQVPRLPSRAIQPMRERLSLLDAAPRHRAALPRHLRHPLLHPPRPVRLQGAGRRAGRDRLVRQLRPLAGLLRPRRRRADRRRDGGAARGGRARPLGDRRRQGAWRANDRDRRRRPPAGSGAGLRRGRDRGHARVPDPGGAGRRGPAADRRLGGRRRDGTDRRAGRLRRGARLRPTGRALRLDRQRLPRPLYPLRPRPAEPPGDPDHPGHPLPALVSPQIAAPPRGHPGPLPLGEPGRSGFRLRRRGQRPPPLRAPRSPPREYCYRGV